MKETTKEGRVPMDFTGERGKVITDLNEIQRLANTRNNVVRVKLHSLSLTKWFLFFHLLFRLDVIHRNDSALKRKLRI